MADRVATDLAADTEAHAELMNESGSSSKLQHHNYHNRILMRVLTAVFSPLTLLRKK